MSEGWRDPGTETAGTDGDAEPFDEPLEQAAARPIVTKQTDTHRTSLAFDIGNPPPIRVLALASGLGCSRRAVSQTRPEEAARLPHPRPGMGIRVTLAYRLNAGVRSIRPIDGLLVVWVAGWILLGLAIGSEVRDLSKLSDTLDQAASAVDETGQALQPLDRLPFVGGQIQSVVGRARATALSARASAASSRTVIARLSWLLTLSIALAPTVPLVVLHLHVRRSRRKGVPPTRAPDRSAEPGAARAVLG
jgi:hypothetical protein